MGGCRLWSIGEKCLKWSLCICAFECVNFRVEWFFGAETHDGNFVGNFEPTDRYVNCLNG